MADIEESAADGIQPEDNPDPAALAQPAPSQMPEPMPSQNMSMGNGNVFAQTAQNPLPAMDTSAPTGAPPPVAAQPAQEQEAKDPDEMAVDSLLADMHGKQPASVKAQEEKAGKFDSLFDEIAADDGPSTEGLVTRRLPGESMFGAIMRNVPEHLKVIGAEMRGRIDSNPKNMLASFQSMYGKDNVKVMGGKVMFRPEPGQKFRSVDETLFNSMTDFVLFNALGGAPLAANMAINVAGQPLAAPFGVPGEMALGGIGGTVEAGMRQGIQAGLNAVSEVEQQRQDLTKDIMWNAGINIAAPPAVRFGIGAAKVTGSLAHGAGELLYKVPLVKRGADMVVDAASSIAERAGVAVGDAAQKVAEYAGPERMQKLAQIRLGANEIRKQLFPESLGKGESQVGEEVLGGVDMVQAKLGTKVAAIKEQALRLSEQKGAKSSMTNTKKKIQELLGGYGYHVDPETGQLLRKGSREAVYKTEPVMSVDVFGNEIPTGKTISKTFEFGEPRAGEAGFDSGLQQLADYHNRILGEGLADGGTKLEAVLNDIGILLDPRSKWDRETATKLQPLFQQVRGATATDRNELIDTLFFGEGSQLGGEAEKLTGKLWKNAFDEYSQNAEAISRMKTLFHTPEERKIMVDAFNKSSTAERNQFAEDLGQVLGKNSKEFKMFKSSLFDNLVESSVSPSTGIIDANRVAKALIDPSNQEFLGKIYDKKEVAILNQWAQEGQRILTKYEATPKSFEIFQKAADLMAKSGYDPIQMVKTILNVSGGEKTTLDYMRDKGFMKIMENAQSPEIRLNILRASSMLDDLTSKMKVIDIKTPRTKGVERSIRRYAPLAGPAMARQITKMTTPQPVLMGEPKY